MPELLLRSLLAASLCAALTGCQDERGRAGSAGTGAGGDPYAGSGGGDVGAADSGGDEGPAEDVGRPQPPPPPPCEEGGGECFAGRRCPGGLVPMWRRVCERPMQDVCCRRDEHCDDDTELACEDERPECRWGQVVAVVEGCWACLVSQGCRPPGEPPDPGDPPEPGCEDDSDCAAAAWCDPCAVPDCPGCPGCVADCAPHGCGTEAIAGCLLERPDCGDDGVGVVRNGCWVCLDRASCQPR